MRYFLDTNILVFMLENPDEIHQDVVNIISDYSNTLYTSSICISELIYLLQINKVKIKVLKNLNDILMMIQEMGVEILYIQSHHLKTLSNLPLYPKHKDPNDRLIVAQAITDKIPVISSDRDFILYEKQGLEFIYNKR